MVSGGSLVPYSYRPTESVDEVLSKMMYRYKCHTTNRAHLTCTTPLSIPIAFPALFSGHIDDRGYVDLEHAHKEDVVSTSALTHLSTTPNLHPTLAHLATHFDNGVARRMMVADGMEQDLYEEHHESLLAAVDLYAEGRLADSSDSESGRTSDSDEE